MAIKNSIHTTKTYSKVLTLNFLVINMDKINGIKDQEAIIILSE